MFISKLSESRARRHRFVRGAVLCASIAAATSCDGRNLAVISLAEVPSSATAITAYYRIDGGDWKTVVPQRGLQQFGLELPMGRSAALETQVFAYANRVPCSLGSAAGTLDLDGGSTQKLDLSLAAMTQHCVAAVEPADFPQGKLAVWANKPNDIWVAGAGGKIVHWDGASYSTVPLPAQLTQTPDWRSIWGTGDEVWIAGTNATVVHYQNGALSLMQRASVVGPTDWRVVAPGDTTKGDLWFVGTDNIIGFFRKGVSGIAEGRLNCNGAPFTGTINAVGTVAGVYPQVVGGYLYRTYFVTNSGGIATYTFDFENPGYTCRGISSPTTKELLDVYPGTNVSTGELDVRIVGSAGIVLRGIASIATNGDPIFTMSNSDYTPFLPPGARLDLHRLGGGSLDDLWIAGQGGLLLRWQNTPYNSPSAASFTQSATGLTADLTSLSSTGTGVLFGGANKALGYTGQLFTPN